MQYRLVYDVLNIGFPWLALFFASVPLLVAIVCIAGLIARVCGKPREPMLVPRAFGRFSLGAVPVPFLILFILLFGFAGVFFASVTYGAFVQERQCQEWARSGQYQVTEGTITDYHSRKGEGTKKLPHRPVYVKVFAVGEPRLAGANNGSAQFAS
jgi:hypothetical protein